MHSAVNLCVTHSRLDDLKEEGGRESNKPDASMVRRIAHIPTMMKVRHKFMNVGCRWILLEIRIIASNSGMPKWAGHIFRTRNATSCERVPLMIFTEVEASLSISNEVWVVMIKQLLYIHKHLLVMGTLTEL